MQKGWPLPLTRKAPAHMHPDPVVAPFGGADGAEVTATSIKRGGFRSAAS